MTTKSNDKQNAEKTDMKEQRSVWDLDHQVLEIQACGTNVLGCEFQLDLVTRNERKSLLTPNRGGVLSAPTRDRIKNACGEVEGLKGVELIKVFQPDAFAASLARVDRHVAESDAPENGGAIAVCPDPFAPLGHPDAARRAELEQYRNKVLFAALAACTAGGRRQVRLLSNSLEVREHFQQIAALGSSVAFGVDLSTVDPDRAAMYEPDLPTPQQRLELLKDAHSAGIGIFVSVAGLVPDTYKSDLRDVLAAVKQFTPRLVFVQPGHAPSGVRSALAERYKDEIVKPKLEVFASSRDTASFMIEALNEAVSIAAEAGLGDQLRLLPDRKRLTSDAALNLVCERSAGAVIANHRAWVESLASNAARGWSHVGEEVAR